MLGISCFILNIALTWEMGEVWNYVLGNKTRQRFLLCVDVDECLRPDVCGEGHCVNTVGAFRCEYCDSGYRMTPRGHCEGESAERMGSLRPFEVLSARDREMQGWVRNPGLAGTWPGTNFPSPPICAGYQLIQALAAFWDHSPFALLQWLCLGHFPPSYALYYSFQYLPSLVCGVKSL